MNLNLIKRPYIKIFSAMHLKTVQLRVVVCAEEISGKGRFQLFLEC